MAASELRLASRERDIEAGALECRAFRGAADCFDGFFDPLLDVGFEAVRAGPALPAFLGWNGAEIFQQPGDDTVLRPRYRSRTGWTLPAWMANVSC